MNRVSIHIVTWNSMPFLKDCLRSIAAQTYRDYSVIVVDNASTDGSVEYIKKHYPEITVLKNPRNLGFAHAHNQAIHLSKSEYVHVTNADTILDKKYLTILVATMDQRHSIGSAAGKLLRMPRNINIDDKVVIRDEDEAVFSADFDALTKRLENANILDSTGLQIKKSRQVIDRGAGEKDSNKYDDFPEVFGVSGALALYRRQALESVRFKDEYFDELFHSYKEDIDLAWRMRRAGWKSAVVMEARALHRRQVAESGKSVGMIKRGRDMMSQEVRYYSYRNHLMMLYKNSFAKNLLLHSPWIIIFETKKFFYLLIFESKTLTGLIDAFKKRKKLREKRLAVENCTTISPKEMRKWFV